MKNKDLKEISWQVGEPEYRADKALSYSSIAKYARGGFQALLTLKDKEESPALTFGSMVDCYLTEPSEFERRFVVAEFPIISDSLIAIAKEMALYGKNISDENILMIANKYEYQKNWKDETRIKNIREKCADYANLLIDTDGKTIVSSEDYNDCLKCAQAITERNNTKIYFLEDPFSSVQNYYQLKFKRNIDGTLVRCMFDVLQVDYDKKTIQPVDLKTTSKPEWEFHKSFLHWRYDIQARLYCRILKNVIQYDVFFKDFQILPFKFVVVNRESLQPLVFEFQECSQVGPLQLSDDIELRDPMTYAYEMQYYLVNGTKVPGYVSTISSNNLSYLVANKDLWD